MNTFCRGHYHFCHLKCCYDDDTDPIFLGERVVLNHQPFMQRTENPYRKNTRLTLFRITFDLRFLFLEIHDRYGLSSRLCGPTTSPFCAGSTCSDTNGMSLVVGWEAKHRFRAYSLDRTIMVSLIWANVIDYMLLFLRAFVHEGSLSSSLQRTATTKIWGVHKAM